jgi:hypothetical protein
MKMLSAIAVVLFVSVLQVQPIILSSDDIGDNYCDAAARLQDLVAEVARYERFSQ